MNGEQLSFLEPIKKATGKREVYDATICYRCCCNKCRYSVEIDPFLGTEECKEIEQSCFNCDECYYYGIDDESLSKNKIKFKYGKFEMSNYYIELEARKRRRNFKIIDL